MVSETVTVHSSMNGEVLILVLVEDGLGGRVARLRDGLSRPVLILVLVEDGLGESGGD